ncbi:ATP-dependent DNA helicase [Anaerotruncus colihominis]|uniref:ATP-dependent DNA helicase n=1 Tax=Anaerotruncus colihominis TaxID=169435 RepID=A0A845SR24_9FIRM|nr:ATP-dependent DNA helicase [Anaerotruncus colihominis]MCR2026650.1 ATP-dependent DNA helicase [Anaerotruncus colihominis]NDO38956.1 ATP-dependent DNA helicase [Anaerotruncus colihominis]
MNYDNNRQNAHNEIDRIFKVLFPTRNMAERPEQAALCHRMLDAMLEGGIALCDAGTGIGKTYAYLVAGTVYSRFRTACGLGAKPILVSTSSIALQTAARDEYLPLLSDVLTEDGIIVQPLQAVIRKGKSHYVCDARLEQRLGQLDLQKKNWKAGAALLSLRGQLDMDEAAHLSGYDRERVCVPRICDCGREVCRYRAFLEDCDSGRYLFQICNHNLLLADAIHRGSGRKPILPDACALIMDEAHKLPETARQMFGVTLAAEDIHALTHSLRGERFLLAAEVLTESTKSLLRKLDRPPEGKPFNHYQKSLATPERSLTVINRQLHGLLTPATRRRLKNVSSSVALFHQGHPDMVFYTEEDTHGGTMLCATIADLTAQLRQTLWRQERPAVLTSATLAVGKDFRRFKEETGLLTDSRVTESVAPSPFDYRQNCLLYLPKFPPRQKAAYYDELAKEIAALLDAAQGHALALFTSYAAMSAVKERLPGHGLRYPLFTMGRSAIHTTEQFKASPGSVLLAAGAAWEGFDFPGDCVSLLIIPRLPFAVPDALKEKERENHPTLRLFIKAVVVPEMQIKLKQGFGRAIRTETDTCVVAILDERVAQGKRYSKDALAALPEMPITGSLEDVARFIQQVKGPDYFREASA